jgi:hypothetical protein
MMTSVNIESPAASGKSKTGGAPEFITEDSQGLEVKAKREALGVAG